MAKTFKKNYGYTDKGFHEWKTFVKHTNRAKDKQKFRNYNYEEEE